MCVSVVSAAEWDDGISYTYSCCHLRGSNGNGICGL